ncbi:MAG: NAD(P)/FAD-dependent oxidoreductase [Deltaproteobacteria bacterium]|nr:NAD(P)/FAD-dependent oxidoreductase [Deltaproteobacteria bacterium]MBW2446209.1 NAD(P)/FAD-dependent oxidoreductase [Deltaproteobacteria bacterium]
MTTQTEPARPDSPRSDLRFLILGAGMSGILTAIKLREAGLNDFAIYEKADRLGGTWRENEYAGVACDVPAHMYTYSFAPNPEWSNRFAAGAEIQEYFEGVAHRYGIDELIQYGKEVRRCEFVDGRWHVELSDGSTDVGDFVIAATGVLHHPAYPDIDGVDDFGGAAFHSARWDHDVPLEGKRVGVIGTGSTAIQIVSALVDRVAELSLFQRTAQWVMPIENPAYSEEEKAEFRRRPEAMEEIRAEVTKVFTERFANILGDAESPLLEAIHTACEENLENSVKDPVLRERLRPDYRAACKRLIMSEDFYEAIQHPNANLVTEEIERIEAGGIRTRDGELHELDVLIFATGFRVDRFMRPMEVIGRDGVTLEDAWRENPSAYMAITVPSFPNLFMLNGPNGPVGNFSLIDVAELQFSYIMQLIEQVRSGSCRELSASQEALERFDSERKEAAKHTIWASGCKSWYLDSDGIPAAWPWTFDRFREEMDKPHLDDFETR